jgi:hypothetical protein
MSPIGTKLSVATLLCVTGLAHATPPRVKVEYGPRQDMLCSMLPGNSIKDEWKAELVSRQPELERLWEGEGPRLLAAAEAISGRAFGSREVIAELTLCNSPSESSPRADRVTVNMRYALASFTPAPVSLRYKSQTLFHELLHILLFQHPIESSLLVEQHAAERERVRGHLHLLALQKAVLLKLDEREALKEVIAVDSALPGGYYKRAWELVNATDGEYLKYVAELSKKPQ